MKLLMCDDDISTLDVIQNQIDWAELGISRILRAYNGNAAKELLLKERPEIILCDIGMPLCDGMEVLRFVREKGLNTQFAFLTCYESFEYAREAIHYNVSNYLTKPLDMKEVKTALKKMTEASQRIAAEKSFREGTNTQRIALRKSFLRALGDGVYGTEPKKIDAALRREKVKLDMSTLWRQVLITADLSSAVQVGWTKELAGYSFAYLAEEAIADRLDFDFSLEDHGDRFIRLTLLIPEKKYTQDELHRRCRRFVQICMTHMEVRPVCLISEPDSLYRFAQSHTQLQELLRKCRLRAGQVLTVGELYRENAQDAALHLNVADVLPKIQARDRTGYQTTIETFLNQLAASRGGVERDVTMFHHDLLQCFYALLHDNRIHPHELFRDGKLWDLDYYAERSLPDAENYAMGLYDRAVAALDAGSDNSDVIGVVKQYIRMHFRENINREELANIAFITPNYLSKRFCSETGMSLREYINQHRVEEAKRLLLSTSKTVSEIACEVGFENISYFSTVFHKLSGVSPVSWRESAGATRNNQGT